MESILNLEKVVEIDSAQCTFLYVVSPEASTPLWPIFFPWAGWPDDEGIWYKKKNMRYHQPALPTWTGFLAV